MLESLRKKRISATMLRHFLLMTMLFPLMYSDVGTTYSPDIVYANIFVVGFVALACLEGSIDWRRKNYLGYAVALCLVGFNVFSFYVNKSFYGWYAGQVNITIAFLFLLAWLFMKDNVPGMDEKTVKFFLMAAAITNLVGVIPGILGYDAVWVSDSGLKLTDWGEICYLWIYSHKSEYSFVLVLFLALTVIYRRLYEKKWMFWASVAVYAVGLWIADTRATMVAALFILAGFMMDHLTKKAGGFPWKYLLWFVPVLVVGALLLYKFSKERDIWTLGHRTQIWKAAVAHILDNPWGIGAMCGLQYFQVEGFIDVPNCHNVFLNYLLQFSIPAGFFLCAIWGLIIIASVWKNRSFTALGIWAALLIPLNMDWCVLIGQTPLVLMCLYFIFFHPLRNGSLPEK